VLIYLPAFSLAVVLFAASMTAYADGSGDPAPVNNEDGKYFDRNGNPTFHIAPDGTVDWYTFSGYRRYHAECHVCHGPDGEGSTYAPGLKPFILNNDYSKFVEVVINGRQNVGSGQESVMPAFGLNKNVACYLDDIYVYLRARANDALPRGRPQKREEKPQSASQAEDACIGQ
jgi:methanol metabolism-related c-type cytochrome